MKYPAIVKNVDGLMLATFPNCPGCQARVPAGKNILDPAVAALEGWLEDQLARGLLRPVRRLVPAGARWLSVPVPPLLAVRIQLRSARRGSGLSQRGLARRLGVSQQQVAQLESKTANLTLANLVDVAEALDHEVEITLVGRSRAAG